MNSKSKILAFAGSTRKNSFNKKVIAIAAEGARAEGAEVTLIDLRDFPMPIYDGDLETESGIPENGEKIINLMIEHQGFLIASPEYNRSVSGVLKNTIDWASRPMEGIIPYKVFEGKVACLMSASTGALGGLRGLYALRWILENLKILVLPEQISVPRANEAFDENGKLKDEKLQTSVANLGNSLTIFLRKLNST